MSKENFIGCLLGGAIGDALGAPTEFMMLHQIIYKYGVEGVQDYVEFPDGKGRITDDTQMTLFTAEAMLRSIHRGVQRGTWGAYMQIAHGSYLRWLHTQGFELLNTPDFEYSLDGWMVKQPELYKRRAPGNTCISALQSGKRGTITKRINVSKGCGGVMRMAPVGLIKNFIPKDAFKYGAELAAITHTHPSGYLSAGAFAAIIAFIREGNTLMDSIDNTLRLLEKWENHEETSGAIKNAILHYHNSKPTFENVEKLGGGWVGEEALAIALNCSLHYQDNFEKGIILSINHSGDTDSTGAITGNILGLLLGKDAIPKRWINNLERNDFITQVGEDLYITCPVDSFAFNKEWEEKYPPN
jgi:ADP-ribosylglycohydrolase